jgi:alpha-1,3-glucan synthase
MLPVQHVGDWDPVQQADPIRPAWGDPESLMDSPGLRSANVSQDNLATGQPLLTPPHHLRNRESVASDMSGDGSNRNSVISQQPYSSFLERTNRQFARKNQNAPDPFMEHGRGGSLTARPFSQYSTSPRFSSVESIVTIVDEKQNSPLNKANESVRDYFLIHASQTC